MLGQDNDIDYALFKFTSVRALIQGAISRVSILRQVDDFRVESNQFGGDVCSAMYREKVSSIVPSEMYLLQQA